MERTYQCVHLIYTLAHIWQVATRVAKQLRLSPSRPCSAPRHNSSHLPLATCPCRHRTDESAQRAEPGGRQTGS